MITRPTLLFALLLASSGCTSALIAQNEPKSTGAASSWITTIKQEWSKIYNDIEADLNFHESDGLDSFDPRSAAVLRQLRNESNAGAEALPVRPLSADAAQAIPATPARGPKRFQGYLGRSRERQRASHQRR